jgi:hypothetical protein
MANTNVRVVTGAQGAGFTGPAASVFKTVNVLSTGATGPEGGKSKNKEHRQVSGASFVAGTMPVVLLAPTGTQGIPTVVIPGFSGPA